MSRTRHHRGQKRRHNGHDLWGKGPGAGECYSAENKKLARQKVRSQRHKNVSLDLDDFIDDMSKTDPDIKVEIGSAKKELEQKRLELGDDLYAQWLASHFVEMRNV